MAKGGASNQNKKKSNYNLVKKNEIFCLSR